MTLLKILNKNKPASPTKSGYSGLSKREYFAAAALTGLLANKGEHTQDLLKTAQEIADNMLEILKDTKE